MSNIYRDKDYSNLVWVMFDGKTWDDYHLLFNEVAEFARANEAIVIAFNPQVEMPKGAPLSHLSWTAELVKKEDNIIHMYAIVDTTKFKIGKIFADLATKVYFRGTPLSVVDSEEAAYEAYHKLMAER